MNGLSLNVSTDPGENILLHILDSTVLQLPKVGALDLSLTKHVVMMWVAGALVLVLARLALRRSDDPVPRGLRNAFEALVVFIRDDVARRAIPHGADHFLGYLLTTFFFIFACNLLGLVPGMSTATGNLSVTAALAVVAFLMIQWGGIREHGFFGHYKNLMPHGVPAFLVPILVPIEILSMFIKPFALCIRLFANMMAGHVAILAFISLIFILGLFAAPVALPLALFIYCLELLVAALQAYIFTMLTAQFIGLSVHPPH